MTDELKYDPELPFVVYAPGSNEVNSRFKYENEALTHRNTATWLEVIDTTPKPKIPEDARFLHWFAGGGNYVAIWENFNPLKPWELESAYYSEEELLEEIGDAEVTVLVRKEDS